MALDFRRLSVFRVPFDILKNKPERDGDMQQKRIKCNKEQGARCQQLVLSLHIDLLVTSCGTSIHVIRCGFFSQSLLCRSFYHISLSYRFSSFVSDLFLH